VRPSKEERILCCDEIFGKEQIFVDDEEKIAELVKIWREEIKNF
jgi:hypothetical protein